MKKILSKLTALTLASLLLAVPVFSVFRQTSAEVLTSRSITVSSPIPGDVVNHRFNFELPTTGSLGSIKFEYCENSPIMGQPCSPPTGFTSLNATLVNQNGETGFTLLSSTTSNAIIITRTSAAVLTSQPVQYTFGNIVNPSVNNKTVFVRISTYASEDATGSLIDEGAVAFATTSGVSVSGYVPPYLIFCVGITVSINCATADGDRLNFGELSATSTRYLTSQFTGATNDPGGFTTNVAGITMTSGNNFIPALSTPQSSRTGTGQFGMNLVANSNPSVGLATFGGGTVVPAVGYGTSNQFKFEQGLIASSPLPTTYNVNTVSYIVNIPRDQPPGVYVSTLTYIAVASF